MTPGSAVATVVITTRNRKEELRRALASVFAQNVPVEVLVMDDASEDGTEALVRTEFPAARVLRSETCLGLITQRNRAAQAATTEHLFSLDDDAEFSSPDTVEVTLEDLKPTRVGAVAIAQIDTLTGATPNLPASPDNHIWCVANYTGTAHALKKSLFVKLGGYWDHLTHQGEEGDYCLRMLAAGYTVRLGHASRILHHESPRRSFERMDYYGRRNDVFFAWRFAPALLVVLHLAVTSLNGLRQAWRTRRARAHLKGLLDGWLSIVSGKIQRIPVSTTVYKLHRQLKKQGPLRQDAFEKSLPPLES